MSKLGFKINISSISNNKSTSTYIGNIYMNKTCEQTNPNKNRKPNPTLNKSFNKIKIKPN